MDKFDRIMRVVRLAVASELSLMASEEPSPDLSFIEEEQSLELQDFDTEQTLSITFGVTKWADLE